MSSGPHTVNIHMDYTDETDEATIEGSIPRAEIDIVYRRVNKDRLVAIEDAYLVNALVKLITSEKTALGLPPS